MASHQTSDSNFAFLVSNLLNFIIQATPSVKLEPHFVELLFLTKMEFFHNLQPVSPQSAGSIVHSRPPFSPRNFSAEGGNQLLTGSGWFLTEGWWEGEMENVTPLAQFSPSLITLPPLNPLHIFSFVFTRSLCTFPPLPLSSAALAPPFAPIMESFLAEWALKLPGCLCVELSKYGK